METFLSIIVPIYNVEAFVKQLVANLVESVNKPDVEVVFINDRSPDNSAVYLMETLNQCKANIRFQYKVIHHEKNFGIAVTRNSGLNNCTGRYLAFLDSDDLLSPHYYHVLQQALSGDEVIDILEFNHQEFSESQPFSVTEEKPNVTVSLGSQLAPFSLGFFLWTRIFRREFVKHQSFIEGRNYEDVAYVLDAYSHAKVIKKIDNTLYFYRKHSYSITAKRDSSYVVQLQQITEQATNSFDRFQDKQRFFHLLAKKTLTILLKGSRIKSKDEKHKFFEKARTYVTQAHDMYVQNDASMKTLGVSNSSKAFVSLWNMMRK